MKQVAENVLRQTHQKVAATLRAAILAYRRQHPLDMMCTLTEDIFRCALERKAGRKVDLESSDFA